MGLFSRFFAPKFLDKPMDFSVIGADMHSHLIPGIDDGSRSMEESIVLIRRLADMGFKKLVTTPHIMQDVFKNTPDIILTGLDNVRKAVKNAGIPIQIDAAAEYLLDDGFMEKFEAGNLLTFGNKFLLTEMSYISPPMNLKEILFELQTAGYKVILAHPERYNYWHKDFDKYQEMAERNVYLQLNTISLSGYYGEDVKKMAEKLVDEKMYSFIGTDMHNDNYMQGLVSTQVEIYLEKVIETNNLLNSKLLA
jgi:protein-tyrosine phosphatase